MGETPYGTGESLALPGVMAHLWHQEASLPERMRHLRNHGELALRECVRHLRKHGELALTCSARHLRKHGELALTCSARHTVLGLGEHCASIPRCVLGVRGALFWNFLFFFCCFALRSGLVFFVLFCVAFWLEVFCVVLRCILAGSVVFGFALRFGWKCCVWFCVAFWLEAFRVVLRCIPAGSVVFALRSGWKCLSALCSGWKCRLAVEPWTIPRLPGRSNHGTSQPRHQPRLPIQCYNQSTSRTPMAALP